MITISAVLSVLLVTQAIPQRTFTGPAIEFPEGFRSIDQVRALPSGELLVAAARPNDEQHGGLVLRIRLYALNFTTQELRAVGVDGRGPGQYMNVGRLLAGPGDTTWMTDEVRPALFVIAPDGQAAGGAPFPAHVLPEAGEGNYSLRFVRTDSAGNFFDIRTPASPERDSTHRDSSVVRYRGRSQAATDTLVWLYETIRRTPSPGFIGFTALPYSLMDAWDVAPNGDVIVVRADEYRVDRVALGGALSRGAPLPYERRAVTKADKDAYIDDLVATARRSPLPKTDYRKVLGRAEWPTHKPPFTGKVVLSHDRVWIPLTPARADDPIIYDVVSFDGTLQERVAMPRGTQIVGFGPGVVYTQRRDGQLLYLAQWTVAP